MDLYGNWGLGLDAMVNYADTVWKTFFGWMALSHEGSKVWNEPQTTVLLSEMQ